MRDALERCKASALPQHGRVDRKAWARETVRRYEAGEPVPALRVREAHLALGLPVPRGSRT